MEVETIKMSSKGQIVIPQGIRQELGTEEGTVFAVFGKDDTIILKRIKTPSKESIINELTTLANQSKAKLQKMGLKEKDVINIARGEQEMKVVLDNNICYLQHCAVDSFSEYIITYDKHLLKIKEYKDIKILTPEEFRKILIV